MQRKVKELDGQAKEAGGRARAWQHKLRSLRLHVFTEDDLEEMGGGGSGGGGADGDVLSQSQVESVSTDNDATPASTSSGPAAKKNDGKLPLYTPEQLAGKCWSYIRPPFPGRI